MKEHIKKLIEKIDDTNRGRWLVREYLQARILQIIQNKSAFSTWVFQGGTALRFLYSIPRFSEDLDFSLVKAGMDDAFEGLLRAVKTIFEAEGYSIIIKAKSEKRVKNAFIKFEGLLFELGYSPNLSEMISIKIEIDTNPPNGAVVTSTVIRKHLLLNIQHHDKSSLLAGKLHALLARKYTKGRDIYDLFWYVSDKTWQGPNLIYLNNALNQTNWEGGIITEENWKGIISERISSFNWKQVVDDVRPFLEQSEDLELLTKDNLVRLVQLF